MGKLVTVLMGRRILGRDGFVTREIDEKFELSIEFPHIYK